MPRYAAETSVTPEQTRSEIERTLRRYGATEFAYGWRGNQALLGFRIKGRYIRFILSMPDREEFRYTPQRGFERTERQIDETWEQAIRQRWRALLLVIKAKLEAVEAGIADFQDEFLSNILLPDNSTVGEWVRPQIDQVYLTGRMPEMLPMLPPPQERKS